MRSRTLYDRDLRRKLLGGASAAALIALSQTPEQARAQDAAPFHLWVDLTGQYSMTSGGKTRYGDPSFDDRLADVGVRNPMGGDGTIGLTLQDDEWFFNFAFNYGRTGTSHANFSYKYNYGYKYAGNTKIAQYVHLGDGHVRHVESHKMLDFTIGQDVGLGMFGMEGTSILSAGVRWANFSATTIGSFFYAQSKYGYYTSRYNYYRSTSFNREIHRTFNGIGPLITWRGSTPVDPQFSFEWGAEAAVLFGKRSVHGIEFFDERSRGATVPQVGGYLGLGWQCPDWPLKFTVGYTAKQSWGVYDAAFDIDGDEPAHWKVGRLDHGPFVKLTVQVQ